MKPLRFVSILKAEEEEAAAPQKMSYTVKLTGFDADKKIALIKELKNLIPGTNLVQVMFNTCLA